MLRDAVQERKEYFLVKLRVFFPPRDGAKEYTIMSFKLTEMTLPALWINLTKVKDSGQRVPEATQRDRFGKNKQISFAYIVSTAFRIP